MTSQESFVGSEHRKPGKVSTSKLLARPHEQPVGSLDKQEQRRTNTTSHWARPARHECLRLDHTLAMLLNIILLFSYMPNWLTLARAQHPALHLNALASAINSQTAALAAAVQHHQHQQHLADAIAAIHLSSHPTISSRVSPTNTLATAASGASSGANSAAASAASVSPSQQTTVSSPSGTQQTVADLSGSASSLLGNQYLNSLTSRSFYHPNHNYAQPTPTSATGSLSTSASTMSPNYAAANSTPAQQNLQSLASQLQYSNHQYSSTGNGATSPATGSSLGSSIGSTGQLSGASPGSGLTSPQLAAYSAAQSAALAQLLYPHLLAASSSPYSPGPIGAGYRSPYAAYAGASPLAAYYSKYPSGAASSSSYLAALQSTAVPSLYGLGPAYGSATGSAFEPTDYSALIRSASAYQPTSSASSLYAAAAAAAAAGGARSPIRGASPMSQSTAAALAAALAGGSDGSPVTGAGSAQSSLYGSGFGLGGSGSSAYLSGSASPYASLYGAAASPAVSIYDPFMMATSYASPASIGLGGAGGGGASSELSPYSSAASLLASPASLASLYSSLYTASPYFGSGASGSGLAGYGGGGSSASGAYSGFGSGSPRISISPLFGSGSQSYFSYLNPYQTAGSSPGGAFKSSLLGGSSSGWGTKLGTMGLGLAGLSLLG